MKSTRLFRNFIFLFSLLGLGGFAWGDRYESIFVSTVNVETMTNEIGQQYLKSDACLSSTSITLQEGESAYVFNSGATTKPNGSVSIESPKIGAFVSVQASYTNLDSNLTFGNWDHNSFEYGVGKTNVNNDTRISGPVELKVRIKPLSGRSYTSDENYWAVGNNNNASYNWDFGASEGFITFRIVGAEQAPSKKFATVIPENASGNVRIVLEQSTDLINWSSANPGVFTPSTSKRFFRVRSVEE